MKKSEAVSFILSKLHHLDLGKDNEFRYAEYSDASQLLEFIEELGFLPPARLMSYRDISNTQQFYSPTQLVDVYHTWDKEE